MKKKESIIQNISYMALMAAINVVFVLLTRFVPILFFLIVFVLPLTSVMVTLHCKKRYFPIYAVATIGLCLICTIGQLYDTIFYVIPSVISGFVFGLLVEKKVPSFWIIISTTVIQILFTYVSIPLIDLITGQSIVSVFATVFGIKDFIYLDYVVPCFIFFMALSQEVLAYVIIREELPKFGYQLNEPKYLPLSLFIGLISSIVLAVIFVFIYGPLSYLFTLFALLFAVYSIAYLVMESKVIIYILLGSSLIVSFFLFGIIYRYMNQPLGLILVNIFFFTVAIIVLINNYLLKENKKDRINNVW